MILRSNFKLTRDYLVYLKDIKHLDAGTLENKRTALDHLLRHCDDKPISELNKLPNLLSQFTGSKSRTIQKHITDIKMFLEWGQKRNLFKLSADYVDSLDASSYARTVASDVKDHKFYTLDQMYKIASYVPTTDDMERTQAAMCFMFLSGIRATAFITLPVDCVHIDERRVEQKPAKGVRTKFRKSADTYLLDIPELLSVVSKWDKKIRERKFKYWFVAMDTSTSKLPDVENIKSDKGRSSTLYLAIKKMCRELDIPEMSAHKLRHGHAIFGLKKSNSVAEFKAVSQNLMHSSLSTTDAIYAFFSEQEIKKSLPGLERSNESAPQDTKNLELLLRELMKKLDKNE